MPTDTLLGGPGSIVVPRRPVKEPAVKLARTIVTDTPECHSSLERFRFESEPTIRQTSASKDAEAGDEANCDSPLSAFASS